MATVTDVRVRDRSLDAIRGVAILFMVLDHSLIAMHGPMAIRYTVTRVSMPLFMLVAGQLVRRLTYRHAVALGLGIVLGIYAFPIVGLDDILIQYVIGAALVVLARRWGTRGVVVLLIIAVTASANWYDIPLGGYGLGDIVALLAIGNLLPRSAFHWGTRFDYRWITTLGKYPLTIYTVHVLILTFVGYRIGTFA